MKKFLSLLLSAVVIFSITAGIDLSAYADEYKYTKDGFEYCTGYTNDVHIYGYSGTAKDIVIPSKIDGKTVTLARIYDCDTIETIYVPKTINDFQGSVIPIPFKGCNNLREINVEKGNKKFYSKDGVMYYTNRNVDYSDYGEDIPIVNKIMKYPAGKTEKEFTIPNGTDGVYQEAFCNSKKLKRVNFPDNIKMIDYRSFANCTGLTAITLPKNIESLAYYSFVGCSSLTSVGIPKSLKTIGMDAFSGCDKIKDVYYEGSKADWKNIDISDWGNESLLNATIHYNAEIDCLAGHSSIEKSVKTTKATTKKNGTVTELCNICGKKIKSTTIYYPKTITLSKTSYVYDGKVKKPTVTVKDSKGNKISSKYYTVTYSSGR
ncbi:MAG: leucine-rich repeat domain-containing protein, partial [Eubacterium sp.]